MSTSHCFAERIYELVTETGDRRDVIVRIGAPVSTRDRDTFCPIEIAGLDVQVPRGAYGADSIQALMLSLQMAHLALRYSDQYRAGRLRFLGMQDLCLPGLDSSGGVCFDPLFQDEGGFAALLGALLRSPALFAWRFREAFGRLVNLSMGRPTIEAFVGSAVRLSPSPSVAASTLDVIACPESQTMLAIGLALREEPSRLDAMKEGYRLLRAEEDTAARREQRSPRRIRAVAIAPGSASTLQAAAVDGDTWQQVDWSTLFTIIERCQIIEGNLVEPVLAALCKGAVAAYETVAKEGPRRWSPTVPDRERVWDVLRNAVEEFHRARASEPSLSELVWAPEPFRGDKEDTLSGSFRPGNPTPRHRRLSLVAVPPEGREPYKVRLGVMASGGQREVRRRELHEAAEGLSWMDTHRRDRDAEVQHEFLVDVTKTEIASCGRPLTALLVEGLLAYARVFHAYLARAN